MKFIVENYSDATTTQPIYLHEALQKSQEHTSILHEPRTESIYDILDKHKPDYYITHLNLLTQDFVTYNKYENQNIRLLLNVSNASQNDIIGIDAQLKNDNVNCPLLFSNIDQKKLPKLKNRRILTLCDAADSNLELVTLNFKYHMDKAYFILDQFDYKDNDPHHIISNNHNLAKIADITLPEYQLMPLYKCYNEIIFCGLKDYIPQSFFDCLFAGCKVYYMTQNQDIINLINTVLKPENSLDYLDKNRMTDFTNLHQYVKEKHCGQNRAKMLLSQLPGQSNE
jgi:hypothetical protein